MMWYRYTDGMMSMGIFMFLTWLVVFADLILLGAWLWKQINKK